jgi:hypothetical protein
MKMLALREMNRTTVSLVHNIPCFSTLYDELSVMLHCGCIILPIEVCEVWNLEPWRKQFLIIDGYDVLYM